MDNRTSELAFPSAFLFAGAFSDQFHYVRFLLLITHNRTNVAAVVDGTEPHATNNK